jgi:hypothetical protein
MIDREATLTHHLLQVSVGELIAAIPADAEQDDRGLEVTPLERGPGMVQEYDSGSIIA